MSKRTCTIAGCDKPYLARGWCQMHFSRWRRTGSPHDTLRADPIERFNARIEKQPNADGCWLWTGHLNNSGYGGFQGNGHRYAHRFSYATFVGPIPNDRVIDHRCRIRHCVNPDHLRLATVAENRQNLSGTWSTSGALNVHEARPGKWMVNVTVDGVRHYGGTFQELAQADVAATALRNRVLWFNDRDRATTNNPPRPADHRSHTTALEPNPCARVRQYLSKLGTGQSVTRPAWRWRWTPAPVMPLGAHDGISGDSAWRRA